MEDILVMLFICYIIIGTCIGIYISVNDMYSKDDYFFAIKYIVKKITNNKYVTLGGYNNDIFSNRNRNYI